MGEKIGEATVGGDLDAWQFTVGKTIGTDMEQAIWDSYFARSALGGLLPTHDQLEHLVGTIGYHTLPYCVYGEVMTNPPSAHLWYTVS